MARPLKILFQKLLDDGKIPDDWRQAEVVPIFKQVAQGQYVVSDTRCPAKHDCEFV